jgi:glycosyltransferase involved in cell wall biosynthesis
MCTGVHTQSANQHIQKSKIAWISFQVLDLFLSKTAYLEISKNLAELGNQVDFFAIRSKRMFESESPNMRLLAVPIRTLPFLTSFFYAVFVAAVLPFYIAVRRPDFLVTEPKIGSLFFSLELKFFPRSLRPRLIMDIRSTPVEIFTFRNFLGALWFNSSVATARKTFDGFTVATEQMKRQICCEFHLNPKAMRVWNNGVDLKLFSPEKYNRNQLRKNLGLNGKFVVFYHGSFRRNGGILEVIKSIKILESKYADIVLFLLGSGSVLPLFKQQIQESKIQNRVIIHAPVDYAAVPKYIAVGDIGIVPLPNIPDWRFQSPLKLVEYLAMRKIVIATDIPANREFIGEDKRCIYVSSVDPEEIAKAIAYAYDNRERLRERGLSERTIAIKDYDWKNVAETFESYLQEFARVK